MRHPFLPMILVVLFGLACRRSSIIPPPSSSTLTGTVVENPGCGHFIVQVLSGSFADSSVVKSWTDTVTGSTFTNVFAVRDWIVMDHDHVTAGDTFSFTLNGPLPDYLNTIYYPCMMEFYPMPPVSNNVTNIQKLP
jgi:hypothetical protein